MSLVVESLSCKIGRKSLLKEVSFSAEEGELIGVLGANGAGKSSLLNCIAQTLSYQSGKVLWNGKRVNEYSTESMARKRAVLTQQINVGFDFETDEVVMMGRYPYFKDFPNEKDHESVENNFIKTQSTELKNRNYLSLSGGEQQRIQITRVLCQTDNPDDEQLLLLDEPLNNLDIKHQHHSLQIAQKFAKEGNVVLAVLHDINLSAVYVDKILLMDQGKVVAFGSPHKVLTETHLYQCYDYPVKVQSHPFYNCPMVHFGYQTQNIQQLVHN